MKIKYLAAGLVSLSLLAAGCNSASQTSQTSPQQPEQSQSGTNNMMQATSSDEMMNGQGMTATGSEGSMMPGMNMSASSTSGMMATSSGEMMQK